jgi:hypothetical protein
MKTMFIIIFNTGKDMCIIKGKYTIKQKESQKKVFINLTSSVNGKITKIHTCPK